VEVDEFGTDDPAMRGEMTSTITLSDAAGGTILKPFTKGLPRAWTAKRTGGASETAVLRDHKRPLEIAEIAASRGTFTCDALETDWLVGAAGFEPLHLRIGFLSSGPGPELAHLELQVRRLHSQKTSQASDRRPSPLGRSGGASGSVTVGNFFDPTGYSVKSPRRASAQFLAPVSILSLL
jgi:hypothetical protein